MLERKKNFIWIYVFYSERLFQKLILILYTIVNFEISVKTKVGENEKAHKINVIAYDNVADYIYSKYEILDYIGLEGKVCEKNVCIEYVVE